MPRSTREGVDHIYGAAQRFKEAALLSTDSLLTPGRPIWTAAALEELNQRFVLQPDASNLSFDQKLARQLTGASGDAVQLMAEIMLTHLLINIRISGKKKTEALRHIGLWRHQSKQRRPRTKGCDACRGSAPKAMSSRLKRI